VFVAAVAGDDQLARERKAALLDRSHGPRPGSWLAVADAWTDDEGRFDDVSWPQGRDDAFSDWSGALLARCSGDER
jgi:hypothetical protein